MVIHGSRQETTFTDKERINFTAKIDEKEKRHFGFTRLGKASNTFAEDLIHSVGSYNIGPLSLKAPFGLVTPRHFGAQGRFIQSQVLPWRNSVQAATKWNWICGESIPGMPLAAMVAEREHNCRF